MDPAASRRPVKLRDIAARAGVSISTVSRVLNNVSGISDALTQHVLSVATELGYERRLQHIGLFTPMSHLGSSHDPFHTDILTGVRAECLRQDIRLSYTVIDEAAPHGAIARKVKQQQIDGLLLLSVADGALVRAMLELSPQLVVINAEHPELPVDTFIPDNRIGPRLATRHLIKHGHCRILHVTQLERQAFRRRHAGYKAALAEAGIAYDPALVIDTSQYLPASNGTYETMRAFLATDGPDFSAVFCAHDHTAISVMHALQEVGRRIPEDVSVVGYDDIATAELLSPPLTTIRIEREELGALAVRRLVERATTPIATPVRVELATRLIERQSVAKPRKRPS